MDKLMKFDFKNIPKFCINLLRNVERYESVLKQFKKHNLDVHFCTAVDKQDLIVPELSPKSHESHADGILACALSHIEIIIEAKNNNLPAICIFEDDVVLCDDFNERIKYIESLPDFDFDILALGGHFEDQVISDQEADETEWKHIKRIKKMNGTYALIITEKVYDFILRNWYYGYGADEFYSDHVYKRFKSFAFVPFLACVTPNQSDILGFYWEYESTKKHYTQHALVEFNKENGKIDLLGVTFIVPVRIETADREFNFLKVIQYLCDTFNTTIIINESDSQNKVDALLKRIEYKGCNIVHLFEQNSSNIFHRTRLLNEMIAMCETDVVVNYDADVLLLPEAYVSARNKITGEGLDLVYPYKDDPTDAQVQITIPDCDRQNKDLNLFDKKYHAPWGSKCGHVQFFKRASYIDGGMENEGFESYGPEDLERMERFIRLGYKVGWLPFQVYHINHSRGPNSSQENPMFPHNQQLYNMLTNLSKTELREYYSNCEYIKKYKNQQQKV